MLSRRARDERGFTMAVTMLVLLLITGLGVVAITTAQGDLRGNQRTTDEKRAYAAAEAGVAFYTARLQNDPDYYAACTTKDDVVRDEWRGGGDTRTGHWVKVPGDPQSEYVIELLTTNPNRVCSTLDDTSILRPDGTVSIRATGRSGPQVAVKRSIVATYRRRSSLDYVSFTDFEFPDPKQVIRDETVKDGTRLIDLQFTQSLEPWLRNPFANGCAIHAQDGRESRRYQGKRKSRGSAYGEPDPSGSFLALDSFADAPPVCPASSSASAETFNGPFHSNDTVRLDTVGNPFGRDGRGDRIELFGAVGNSPQLASTATLLTGAQSPQLPMPAVDDAMSAAAAPNYRFYGKTTLRMGSSGQLFVSNATRFGASTQTLPWPTNGVIAVHNRLDGACPGYNPDRPYSPSTSPESCGQAWVEGEYSRSLTIAADDDVVVTGNITKTADKALLGLVARKFVRLFHPVRLRDGSDPNLTRCTTANSVNATTPGPRTIEAAVLSIDDAFTVDNYACGEAPMGRLKVIGAVAQRFRGRIANANAGPPTGYTATYDYNDELKYRAPPYFVVPLAAQWSLARATEATEAR